jgi:3D (Asp-Asp-Asp) domain-containing protein
MHVARRPQGSGEAWRGSRKLFLAAAAALVALLMNHATAGAEQLRPSVYEVLPGDTLSGIAAKFDIDVDTIVRTNSLGSADLVQPGQSLTILPMSGVNYTVRPGDSLLAISYRYDVDAVSILRWNDLDDEDHIVIGSELLLPGARPPRPEPAAPARAAAAPAVTTAPAAPRPAPEPAPVGSSFTGKITAYTYQAPIGSARGSTTRSGTPVRWGVLAVDPLVIPLGSKVMIEGFDDVFVAEDTGSAVSGNHVEIFHLDYASAIRFGVQTRRVTILDH